MIADTRAHHFNGRSGEEGTMTQTKEPLFVLFTAPCHQIASGACYIALDGLPTILRSNAARFQSFADAKAFAKEHRIALNGLTYFGLEDFTDGELKSSEEGNYVYNLCGESLAQEPLAA
jgi:hypothetical protein